MRAIRFFFLIVPLVITTLNSSQAQDEELFENIGRFCQPWTGNCKLTANENTVCVAQGDNGLVIIDIRDPENPCLAGTYQYTARDVSISGDHAFVLGNYLRILDISDPSNPVEIGVCEVGGVALDVSGDFAYVQGNIFFVIDISDLTQPEIVGSLEVSGNAVCVQEDYAYTTSGIFGDRGILRIIDLTDPSEPLELGSHQNQPVEYSDVEVSGTNVYVADPRAGIRIFDVSDPNEPEEIRLFNAFGVTDIFLFDQYAYLAIRGEEFGNDLVVLDVSDIDNIDNIGEFCCQKTTEIAQVFVSDNCVYLTYRLNDWLQDGRGGGALRIIDISDLDNIVQTGQYSAEENSVWDVTVCNDYAYATHSDYFYGGNDYLSIWDITRPQAPGRMGEYITDRRFRLSVWGDLIFLSYNYEVRVLDISDPLNPEHITTYDFDFDIMNISVINDLAYTVETRDWENEPGESRFRVFNISDPRHPELTGHCEISATGLTIQVEDEIAYVLAVNDDLETMRLISVDVSNPNQPGEMGFISTDYPILMNQFIFVDMCVTGNLVCTALDGVNIFNFNNPANPVHVCTIDTISSAFSIYGSGDNIYVNPEGGLRVFDISDLNNINLIGRSNVDPISITKSGDQFFFAMGDYASIYRFNDPEGVDDYREENIPEHPILSAAYPNPFNSTTTIEYVLPFASQVSMNLYNLSGQRIEMLVNGRFQAGMHQVTLNMPNTSSGLYFVKLETEGQMFTQKIMLLK